ncbi:DUF2802 domain-containing protein [Legionella spiritensis]|uniref:DUF2802 domain-containing protein n=1 Tax=Legionella spiritensis TaxID=452 RepID=UPI000F70CE83|nr:DUF2802 domain-containing protein [Legionella spiritensis]VEG90658.1 Protein of uncharacterised function (DUF2802) [Legionella spiritensis]
MIIAVSMGVLITVVLSYRIYKLHKKLTNAMQKIAELDKLLGQHQLEQSAVVNADLVFARQLADINRQLISMDNQLQSLETKRHNDGGYQHALRILEMGGNKEEIVDSCHLSNAEAELLVNLHAYRSAIKTGAPS